MMLDQKSRILVVDDDRHFLQTVSDGMGEVYKLFLAPSVEKAIEYIPRHDFDLVLLDLVFEPDSSELQGFKLLSFIKEKKPDLPVIIISTYENQKNIVRAFEIGAELFLRKGNMDYLGWINEIRRILRKVEISGPPKIEQYTGKKEESSAHHAIRKGKDDEPSQEIKKYHSFVGNTGVVLTIKEHLVALSHEPDITILLLGETGVGKEVAAHYLHENGARRNGPFRAVNLAVVTETFLESTLFGHKKGAFTGATADSIGAFGEAERGVLFLDEIGEIKEDLQVKLLRFLQNKIIRPVGGKERMIDVQIVAATNKSLKEEVARKRFRADLYQRLNAFPITIPPLRDRKTDIPLIIEHYLSKEELNREVFSDKVWERLRHYHWPGNIRELSNIVNRLILKRRILKFEVVEEKHLPEEFFLSTEKAEPPSESQVGGPSGIALPENKKYDLQTTLALTELGRIEEALTQFKRKRDVVDVLGLKNNDQLRYKVNKYFEKFPHLFHFYPMIREKYKLK